MVKTLSPIFFLKVAQWPIRNCLPFSSHLSTCNPLSLSVSLSSLSLLPLAESSISILTVEPFLELRTCQTLRKRHGRRSDGQSPSPRLWAVGPMRLSKGHACNSVFGCFQRCLATFHGKATYFGMSSPSSTKSCPS